MDLTKNTSVTDPRPSSTKVIVFITLTSAMSAAAFGFGGNCFGQVNPLFYATQFGWDSTNPEFSKYNQYGNLCQNLGANVGNFTIGQLSQRIGRRYALILSSTLGLIGSVLIQFNIIYFVLLARALIGIAIGAMVSHNLVYLKEMLPESIRKSVAKWPVIMLQLMNFFSHCLTFGFKFFKDYYRLYLGFNILIYTGSLILLLFYVKHDPPRFLLLKGKKEEAIESLKFIYHPDDIGIAYARVYNMIKFNKGGNQGLMHIFADANRKRTFYGMIMSFSQFFGGVSFIGINIADLVTKAAGDAEGNYDQGLRAIYSTLYGFCFLTFTIIGTFLVDRFGRKKTITVGGFFHFVSLVLIGFVYCYKWFAYLPYCLYLFAFGQAIGFNMFFILLPEIVEPYAIDISYNVSLIAMLSPNLFAYIKSNGVQTYSIFFVLACYVFGFMVFFIRNIKETKGKTKEEIMKDYIDELPDVEPLERNQSTRWSVAKKPNFEGPKKRMSILATGEAFGRVVKLAPLKAPEVIVAGNQESLYQPPKAPGETEEIQREKEASPVPVPDQSIEMGPVKIEEGVEGEPWSVDTEAKTEEPRPEEVSEVFEGGREIGEPPL